MKPNKPIRRPTDGSSAYMRLNAGMYALGKLSGAGLVFVVLSLLALLSRDGRIPESGWLTQPAYSAYAYALPFSVAADGLLRLLPPRDRTRVTAWVLHAATGILAGFWLAADQGTAGDSAALAGIAALLLFRLAQAAGERASLLLPVFALFLPTLCLLLN